MSLNFFSIRFFAKNTHTLRRSQKEGERAEVGLGGVGGVGVEMWSGGGRQRTWSDGALFCQNETKTTWHRVSNDSVQYHNVTHPKLIITLIIYAKRQQQTITEVWLGGLFNLVCDQHTVSNGII